MVYRISKAIVSNSLPLALGISVLNYMLQGQSFWFDLLASSDSFLGFLRRWLLLVSNSLPLAVGISRHKCSYCRQW